MTKNSTTCADCGFYVLRALFGPAEIVVEFCYPSQRTLKLERAESLPQALPAPKVKRRELASSGLKYGYRLHRCWKRKALSAGTSP